MTDMDVNLSIETLPTVITRLDRVIQIRGVSCYSGISINERLVLPGYRIGVRYDEGIGLTGRVMTLLNTFLNLLLAATA